MALDPITFNSMQYQAGLMPPQVIFPGQVSAAIAAQGGVGAFGSFFPTQTYQTAIGTPPIFQGPTGVMAPINPSAPYNPYASQNPYAGLSAYGAFQGRPSPFSPYAPNPPPAYGGFQGQGAVPFAPAPPPPAFDTPYGGQLAQAQAAQDRSWLMGQGARSVGARVGADLTAAGAGAMLGRRFGVWGAAVGGVAGLLGAELSGAGQGAQNLYGSWVGAPRLAEYGAGAGIEHLSRGFVSGGPYLHASGQGFSHHASMEAAQGLTAMAGSASFRRETRDRFNQQDLFKITQGAAESGLMTGVGSPDQMTSRVRDVARSLSAFMELAREPDVVRAIQTMGSLRSSGLNLHETMSAVSAGRSFARMAGTSFQGLAELGGSMGSQAFQSMGLTQGLGFQVGMGNYAQAAASINRGTLSPQLAALTGGAQGLGTLNTMFSGALTQLPMVTPGMMSAGGGLNAASIQGMLSGQSNLFSMTGRGAGVLSGMADRYGVGGLGMAVAMQPMLQDSLGRILQAQGPFAQRNMEDRQVLALARQMGMSGSQGFLTAAQTLGMDRNQALARATEMGSGTYWQGQRAQLDTHAAELHAQELQRREANEPGFGGTLYRHTAIGRWATGAEHLYHNAARGIFGGPVADFTGPTTDEGIRALRATYGTDAYRAYARDMGSYRPAEEGAGGLRHYERLSRFNGVRSGASWLGAAMGWAGGGGADDVAYQRREMNTGAAFADDLLHSTIAQRRRAAGLTDSLFGSTAGLSAVTNGLGGLAAQRGALPGMLRGAGDLASGLASVTGVGAAPVAGVMLGIHAAVGMQGISGGNVSEIYRQAMSRQGMSADQIARNLREHGGDIAAAVGQRMDLAGMTPEQQAAWEHTADFRNSRRADNPVGEQRVNQAFDALGLRTEEQRKVFQETMQGARGIGREGTDLYRKSQNAIAALALLRKSGQSGMQASAAQDRLLAQFTPAQRQQIVERAIRQSNTLGEGATDVGRAMASHDPGHIVQNVNSAEETQRLDTAYRRATGGFEALTHVGGVIGRTLQGVDTRDHEAVRRALGSMSREDLDELRRQGGASARQADQIARGDFTGFTRDASALGERADRMRTEWDQAHSGRRAFSNVVGAVVGGVERRIVNRVAEAVGSNFRVHWDDTVSKGVRRVMGWDAAGREADVNRALTPNSAAGREALLQGQDSAAAQGQAEGAGMGRAGDALLEASRELHEAAEQLRSGLAGANLNSLVTQ